MWYFLSFNLLRICIASIIVCYAIKFLLTLPNSNAVSVSGGYLSGKISIDKNVPASTYIGNTGFVSCNSEVSASVTTDGFLVLSGNYGLKITSSGINITKDGGKS